MIKLSQAIVVEGRYDLNALRQIVDAPIFTTDGFHVMKDKQLLHLLRRVAQERGLIILTDSDGAGFVIRNYLAGALPGEHVYHAYIPEIAGKERRKAKAGKEGLLGVEGMRPEVLLSALMRAGVMPQNSVTAEQQEQICKADLVMCGLSGGVGSAEKRKKLLSDLDFPEKMSTNAMLRALNLLFDRETFLRTYSND